MDALLEQALQRREQLRAELEAIDRFIHSYSAVREGRRMEVSNADLFRAVEPRTVTGRAARSAAVNAAMKDAVGIILEAGRPLSRSEVLRRLEERGHVLEGGDKSKVLGTNLWRSGLFLNLKGAGYWPKSTPLPNQYADLSPRDSLFE